MTQPLSNPLAEPLTDDQLDVIIANYRKADDMPPGKPGEATNEWLQRVDAERGNAAWQCVDAIPQLIGEIWRLKGACPGGTYVHVNGDEFDDIVDENQQLMEAAKALTDALATFRNVLAK